MGSFAMSLISFAVCLAFCGYVYLKDDVEKEPFSLLSVLFISGAVSYVAAYFTENALLASFDKVFFDKYTTYNSLFGSRTWNSTGAESFHRFLCAFIAVALVEELFKWIVLFFITYKSKHFNCLFDGVIYSIFVSVGFALAESIRFAAVNSSRVFMRKFVVSLPVHILLGGIMGAIYTFWHIRYIADRSENKMIRKGVLKHDVLKFPVISLVLSIIIPVLAHTVYAYIDMLDNEKLDSVFYIVGLVIMVICFIYIAVLSKHDKFDTDIADKIISDAHVPLGETPAPSADYDGRPENGEVE